MSEVTYGRTPEGQLLYDLGFSKLSEKYLARKHKKPIAKIRQLRKAVKSGLRAKKKP